MSSGIKAAFLRSLLFSTFIIILLPLPVSAATADEIIAMSDAGLSAQVIIDVIDATGFEGTLDSDTLIYLLDHETDYEVIEFLLTMTDDEDKMEVSAYENYGYVDSERPNYAGGPGFGSSNNEYRSSGTGYWSGYNDYHNDRSADYYYGYRVYQPPVYIYSGRHNYYYYEPYRYYGHSRNWPYTHTWTGGRSHYYDDYWNDSEWDYHPRWNDPWHSNWYDGFSRYGTPGRYWDYGNHGGLRGFIGYNPHSDEWYSDWDAWYRTNRYGIRISF